MTDTKPLPEANQPDGAGNRLLDKVQALSDNPGAASKFLAQGAAMENAGKTGRPPAEPIPFELGIPAELAPESLEMPLTTSEDRDADWVGLPSDSAGLTRFLTASDNDGQGPKGALSWRGMMKDMLQESASEGSKAPSAEDLSVLRERRRKCLGLEDNQAAEQSAKLSGPKP